MGFFNGYDASSSQGNGTPGEPGRGVSTISAQDNQDGTIDLTFHMSDNTDIGPIQNNLVSDALIQLDVLTLTGTANRADKLLVQSSTAVDLLRVNTITDKTHVYGNFLVDRQNKTKTIFEVDKFDNIKMSLDGASTFSSNKHTILYDPVTRKLFYEDTGQIIVDGTTSFFNDTGDVLLSVIQDTNSVVIGPTGNFIVDTANSVATFTVDSYNVVTTAIVQEATTAIATVTTSYQVIAPAVQTVAASVITSTPNTVMAVAGAITSIFRRN